MRNRPKMPPKQAPRPAPSKKAPPMMPYNRNKQGKMYRGSGDGNV